MRFEQHESDAAGIVPNGAQGGVERDRRLTGSGLRQWRFETDGFALGGARDRLAQLFSHFTLLGACPKGIGKGTADQF